MMRFSLVSWQHLAHRVIFLLTCRTKMSNPLPEDDNMFDDVDVGLPPVGGGNAISTSEDGNVDALLKELDSEFAIGGDSDEEDLDVLDLDGGASDVAAATPSVVESAIESLVVSSEKMATSSTMGPPANNGATSSSAPSGAIILGRKGRAPSWTPSKIGWTPRLMNGSTSIWLNDVVSLPQ